MDYTINSDVVVNANSDESGRKAVFEISNVMYTKIYEPFYLHFTLIAGLMETIFERLTGEEVKCEAIRVDDDEAEIAVEII
jgi:hypothetical protein